MDVMGLVAIRERLIKKIKQRVDELDEDRYTLRLLKMEINKYMLHPTLTQAQWAKYDQSTSEPIPTTDDHGKAYKTKSKGY